MVNSPEADMLQYFCPPDAFWMFDTFLAAKMLTGIWLVLHKRENRGHPHLNPRLASVILFSRFQVLFESQCWNQGTICSHIIDHSLSAFCQIERNLLNDWSNHFNNKNIHIWHLMKHQSFLSRNKRKNYK